MPKELTDEDVALIRRNYKRCSEETVEAIIRFRRDYNIGEVPAIAKGIIKRYLPASHVDEFANAGPETPLADLRIESLTMLEIVLDIQDALEVTIEDNELREFKTLGDVLGFLERKVKQTHSLS